MEQQSISISKAGIVTTLQARCAVIAAANPIGGRYDISKTFSENVALTDPILTRFDVLCMMRDEVDGAHDERLATFVLDSHTLCHPDVQHEIRLQLEQGKSEKDAKVEALRAAGVSVSSGMLAGPEGAGSAGGSSSGLSLGASSSSSSGAGGAGAGSTSSSASAASSAGSSDGLEPIPQALLKKYIIEARALRPALAGIDQDKVPRLYAELRREAEISGGIPIAVRHIESIMRMSEAAARMRLSSHVNDSDLNLAIRVMLESFISAQKYNVTRTLRRHFSRYLESGADYNQLLLVKLKELVREKQALEFVRSRSLEYDDDDGSGAAMEIKISDLQGRARRHGVQDDAISAFLSSALFKEQGFSYDFDRRVIIKELWAR
jgi:DNA replication licensing factor MCM2